MPQCHDASSVACVTMNLGGRKLNLTLLLLCSFGKLHGAMELSLGLSCRYRE